jgi:hypothetical protein
MGTVYAAEVGNDRVTRWSKGEIRRIVVLNVIYSRGLSFDQQDYINVIDFDDYRVQQLKL